MHVSFLHEQLRPLKYLFGDDLKSGATLEQPKTKQNKATTFLSYCFLFFFDSCESKIVIKNLGHLKTKLFLGCWGPAMLHGTGRAPSVVF